ncbi:hypothetical protein GJ744_004516 [Endocarpon pusillum]|uniref:ER membrane protein complex subunit 2 n=1 Tax=Endocarpon pusillum TaxID=364733 RepID=A0A8H7AWD9_9EURO|nr:hypothetical protein GJ744_004516 [Endocarpon pusillum]
MALPASQSDPSSTLQLSQKAPLLLSTATPASHFFPLTLLEKPETPATWTDYERLFQACLRAGDDKSAHLCLERLTMRFGASDSRVMGLRGMYQEAIATSTEDLERILRSYEKILRADPMNVPILKRRIAIKKSLARPQEAISALVEFLESNATDAEAWCEVADLYHSQGMNAQAIFSMEEALLIAPNAWNLHARMGELEYSSVAAGTESAQATQKLLADAVRRFSRSIELCDGYLRGYYGLKIASHRLLENLDTSTSSTLSDIPPRNVISQLHDHASKKLEHIIDTRSTQIVHSDSARAELIAAQELLDRSC